MELIKEYPLEVVFKFKFDRTCDGIIIIERKAFLQGYPGIDISDKFTSHEWARIEDEALREYENPCEMSLAKALKEYTMEME